MFQLSSNSTFIAHHIIEDTIDYIDDLDDIREAETRSNIDEANGADAAEIRQLVDCNLVQLNELIDKNFSQDSNWKEKLRQQKKKHSDMIKKEMGDFQSGLTTWAKFATTLSRTMGSDAPMIAGFILLTSKVLAPDLYEQIRKHEEESGAVANKFIEKNFTDATREELQNVNANYANTAQTPNN